MDEQALLESQQTELPMADEEQLKRLKQGVDAWNKWRRDNPTVDVKLSNANLIGAELWRANLNGVNLIEANLSLANLSRADLITANLTRAILIETNLIDANLIGANLTEAILIGADLSMTQALSANFTGANLTRAYIQDWNINKQTMLDDINCEYVYMNRNFLERFRERRPSDPSRNFEPGEFTKLFQKALSTVDLIFRNGVDWQALLISLEKLRVEADGAELTVQAIENKNDGAFVVRVNVPPDADKGAIEKFVKQEYEIALKVIEARYEMQLQLQGEQLQFYREEMAVKRQDNTQLIGVLQKMAENQSKAENQPKYNIYNPTFGNFADTVQDGGKQQAIQHIYAPEQNLAAAAAEIQQLLNQLAASNPNDEEFAEVIRREIQKNPTLKARLVNALKSGGLEALKAIFNHPVFSIPAETVKGWLEAEG